MPPPPQNPLYFLHRNFHNKKVKVIRKYLFLAINLGFSLSLPLLAMKQGFVLSS